VLEFIYNLFEERSLSLNYLFESFITVDRIFEEVILGPVVKALFEAYLATVKEEANESLATIFNDQQISSPNSWYTNFDSLEKEFIV